MEYSTFHITARDGRDVEMAVIDEFDYDHKHYVVGSVVENDVIKDDGQFIYRCHIREDGFEVSQITNALEFEKVSAAYLEMDD